MPLPTWVQRPPSAKPLSPFKSGYIKKKQHKAGITLLDAAAKNGRCHSRTRPAAVPGKIDECLKTRGGVIESRLPRIKRGFRARFG